MGNMTQEIIDTINHEFCYWATVDENGVPHMSIEGSTIAVSNDSILMIPRFKKQTFDNLLKNPKAAVIVYSSLPHDKTKTTNDELSHIEGFQIIGTASVLTSGETYEQTKDLVAKLIHPKMAEVMEQSVILKVEAIYSAGLEPEDGQRIG